MGHGKSTFEPSKKATDRVRSAVARFTGSDNLSIPPIARGARYGLYANAFFEGCLNDQESDDKDFEKHLPDALLPELLRRNAIRELHPETFGLPCSSSGIRRFLS